MTSQMLRDASEDGKTPRDTLVSYLLGTCGGYFSIEE